MVQKALWTSLISGDKLLALHGTVRNKQQFYCLWASGYELLCLCAGRT